jgi:uncharacterized protein (TIGR02284 family)
MIILNAPIFKITSARSSLARNLLRVTLTFYLSLAFLLTLGQLILEYRNEKNRLGEEIENVALTFNPIISKALWNVDEDQTLASLQGMLKINHDIKEIELMDANNIQLHHQTPQDIGANSTDKNSLLAKIFFDKYDYSYKVTYSSEYTQEKVVGYIVLKSNSLVVLNRAAHTFLITIISAIFKTLLLSAIFYFIIQKMVGRPLKKITHKMRDFDAQDHQVYIADEALLSRDDELGVMVKTFSAMTNALIIKDNDLKEYSQSLEKKVQQRTYQLEKASKAKSEFFAAMSHEIRTPLNGVLGLVNLLAETPLSHDQLQYIEHIQKSGDSLIHIINNLLDNLKIESNKVEMEQIEFDLESTFNESIALFLDKSKKSGINIITIYSPNSPKLIVGDPTRIRQIVVNLLGNAFKFTQQGHIILQAQCDSNYPNTITISISDTGIGIKASLFERLFSPYDQADSSTTRLYGGTGLGLCICKQLVELMGGTIGVESEINKGSTFWFRIPFAIAATNTQRSPIEIDAALKPALLYIENDQYKVHIKSLLSQYTISSNEISDCEQLMECITNSSPAPLKSLVQTLNDGIEFYRVAAQKVEHEDFRQAFDELAQSHALAKAYLQPYLIMQTGVAEEGHTFGGKLHHTYTELEDNGNLDHDYTLLKQLEQVETITLDMMQVTAALSENALVKTIIKGLMPQMQACRERVIRLEEVSRLEC